MSGADNECVALDANWHSFVLDRITAQEGECQFTPWKSFKDEQKS